VTWSLAPGWGVTPSRLRPRPGGIAAQNLYGLQPPFGRVAKNVAPGEGAVRKSESASVSRLPAPSFSPAHIFRRISVPRDRRAWRRQAPSAARPPYEFRWLRPGHRCPGGQLLRAASVRRGWGSSETGKRWSRTLPNGRASELPAVARSLP